MESVLSVMVNEFIPHEELGWEEHTLSCLNYALKDWNLSLLDPPSTFSLDAILPRTEAVALKSSLKESAALKKAILAYLSNICMAIESRNINL